MAKTFRVGLVYINTNNLGDIVIFDCARYLIEEAFKSKGFTNYEIIPIDMGERAAVKSKTNPVFQKRQQTIYKDANKYVLEWKTSKAYQYLKVNELPKIAKLDLIVFGGGGLIKFHEQQFHMYIDEITAAADLRNIPVVFNSVGVEGYDDSDPRCQILKKALSRRCVYGVSTRDNLKLLKDKYLPTKPVKLVSDPALWAAEAYKIRKSSKTDIIGLGVIRPEIFELYGHKVSKDSLLKFYKELLVFLEQKGLQYKLFSNGGRRDFRFIEEIKESMGRGDKFNVSIKGLDHSGKDLAKTIAGFSRIIAFRMHAAVLASAFGIPVISIVWNDKQKFFAELTGQESGLVSGDELSKADVVAEKLLRLDQPLIDPGYKNSDRDFIFSQVWHAYRWRHLTKAVAMIRSLKRQIIKNTT